MELWNVTPRVLTLGDGLLTVLPMVTEMSEYIRQSWVCSNKEFCFVIIKKQHIIGHLVLDFRNTIR